MESVKIRDIEIKENERIDDLQLKGYKIIQNTDGFCFGMDAVLVANYAKTKKNDIAVDLGTGTCIIPLIINAKNSLQKMYAVEIQKEVADMARRSVEMNGLEEKIEVINTDINSLFEYFSEKGIEMKNRVDVVVSNPPYMSKSEGLHNETEKKRISRHEVSCDIDDICRTTGALLKHQGKFYLVHRPSRLADIIESLRKYKLEPKEMRFVYPNMKKPANLILIKAVKAAKPELRMKKPLIVYNDDGSYTDEIHEIYGLDQNREVKNDEQK